MSMDDSEWKKDFETFRKVHRVVRQATGKARIMTMLVDGLELHVMRAMQTHGKPMTMDEIVGSMGSYGSTLRKMGVSSRDITLLMDIVMEDCLGPEEWKRYVKEVLLPQYRSGPKKKRRK